MSYDPTKWHAVVYDEDGFVVTDVLDRLDGDEDGDDFPSRLALVTGSAVPRPQSSDPDEEFYRAPSSYKSLDLFADFELDSIDIEDIKVLWHQAEAFAAAVNKES